MTATEAKARVHSRHPKAIIRRERVNTMEPRAGVNGAVNLKPRCYDGFTVYTSARSNRPLGSGLTEDDAWIDCIG